MNKTRSVWLSAMSLLALVSAPVAAQILPVKLGTSSNCSSSYGKAINNANTASPLQVAAQGSGCPGSQPRALLWTASTGMIDLGTIGGALGASTEGVSDDGTAVGWLGGGVGLAFVRPLGGPMAVLPKLSGMTYASAYAISPNGAYIVGSNSTDLAWQAVRWDRSSGSWKPRALYAGDAWAVSNNGAVVGTMNGQARIWTENGLVTLPGTDTEARDISASGTAIVGFRWQSCPEPCGEYEVPMVWILKSGVWIAQELQALDGVDSEALGVAVVNGKAVIVGYGYTNRDAIMRAVAWIPDSGGNYGAPIRLAAIGGRNSRWARAADVNASGKVVGTSAYTGLKRMAVRWTLTVP
jgi:uncharacterized membrane protein